MAKKIPVLMKLESGSVIISYEIQKGSETGLYHVKTKTGTVLLYTEQEMKEKVKKAHASSREEKEDVTVDDLILD